MPEQIPSMPQLGPIVNGEGRPTRAMSRAWDAMRRKLALLDDVGPVAANPAPEADVGPV